MKSDQEIEQDHEDFISQDRPTDKLMASLWDSAQLARKRAEESERAIQAETLPDTEANAEIQDEETPSLSSQRSLPLEARLRVAAKEIETLGPDNVFSLHPVRPGREFPTFLTRIPIFRPSKRSTQQKHQDEDNSVSFTTSWGTGRRHGPPLTIRDEDTLIALLNLRDRKHRGPITSLPANLRDIHQPKGDRANVHRVTCTIDQINDFLGLTDGGANFKYTLASLRRLNACTIEIQRMANKGVSLEGNFSLVKIQMAVFNDYGLIDAVFPPLMAHWLEESYTYLDWEIRKQLSPFGKATHRFLSSQRKDYEISLNKFATAIGYDGRANRLKSTVETSLQELVKLKWLDDYEFRGSGRSTPYIISTKRGGETKLPGQTNKRK